MNKAELAAKSVLELRAVAKEYKVKLSAGIKKAEILERLYPVACADDSDESLTESVISESSAEIVIPEETSSGKEAECTDNSDNSDNTAEETAEAIAKDIATAEAEAASQPVPAETNDLTFPRSPYQKAYHNPMPAPVRRINNAARSNFGQPGSGFGPRSTPRPTIGRSGLMQSDHPNAPRTVSRFGPSATQEPAPEAIRQDPSPSPEQAVEQPSIFNVPVAPERPVPPVTNEPKPMERPTPTPVVDSKSAERQPLPPISASELLVVNDLKEGYGYLELHPEGYGFLRPATLAATSNDVYVSVPQIKRFGLRNGDYVTGRLRPMRENDRCGFLLTVESINNISVADKS